MSHRVFCDANIFMYAAGREHPYRAACLDALRVVARKFTAVTDAEVLQELLHRYAGLGRSSDARSLVNGAMDSMHETIAVEPSDVLLAADLVAETGISARDAVHVAVMRRCGITRILTADRDFDRIEGVLRLDPAQLASEAG